MGTGSITVLPKQKSGGELFNEAFQPYLQMAMQAYLTKQMGAPAEARAQSAEQRAQQKEIRDIVTGVSKGELDPNLIPENVRSQIFKQSPVMGGNEMMGPGGPSTMTPQQAGSNLFKPPSQPLMESPQAFGTRLQESAAKQSQAMSPWKGLQAQTLTAKAEVQTLLDSGVAWENIPIPKKIAAGFMGKEKSGGGDLSPTESLNQRLLGAETPAPTDELVEVTNPQGKKTRIKKSQLAEALKSGYKQ